VSNRDCIEGQMNDIASLWYGARLNLWNTGIRCTKIYSYVMIDNFFNIFVLKHWFFFHKSSWPKNRKKIRSVPVHVIFFIFFLRIYFFWWWLLHTYIVDFVYISDQISIQKKLCNWHSDYEIRCGPSRNWVPI